MFLPKLQTLAYDILPPLEEGAGKRCSECGSRQDNYYGKRCDDGDGFLSTALQRGGMMETGSRQLLWIEV